MKRVLPNSSGHSATTSPASPALLAQFANLS